jgi:hypothetical protein
MPFALGLPQNLLALDADLVAPPSPRHEENGGDKMKMMAMRHAVERLLAELKLPDEKMAAVVDLLNEYAPEGRDESPDDEETAEERERRLVDFLRARGFGQDDIRRACDFAAGRPENAFEGGLRGGKLAGDRSIRRLADRITVEPTFGSDRRMSQAEATRLANSRAATEARFPDMKRIATW